ncbi:hypothetical protein [Patulibacter americanus]|uniref:hypothetical protein n=1 Tax=Patulibacter americanus TaxID=588672 RepID=UPI0012FCDAFA|nr:hypothetical protein [Patulibacter americanus]
MRVRRAVVALAVAGGIAAVPSAAVAAVPAGTTWAGWDAPGPLGVGIPSHVTASGATTAILGSDTTNDVVPLAVMSAAGSRVGDLPVGEYAGVDGLSIAAAGSDRLLLAQNCTIRRSEDRGLTWRAAEPLALCSGHAPVVRAVSSDVAFASIANRTWRTTDGGATWPVMNASERAPDLPIDALLGLRIVGEGPKASALQRTVDGGASWQSVMLPAPPEQAPPVGPTPPTDAPATPAPTPAPAVVGSLPRLAGLARRGDGTILLGAGDALLVSTDGGQTFARRPVPDLPGSGGVVVESAACGPAGGCVVGVETQNDPKRRIALRYAGDAFGGRVAALPASHVSAPDPDVVLGLTSQEGRNQVVRTDDAGATPYREVTPGPGRTPSLGRHGLLAISSLDRLHVSADHGATWDDVPMLTPLGLVGVTRAAGKLVALANDGTVRRLDGGTWTTLADLRAIEPTDLAVAGDVPIVVGERGVVRLTGAGSPEPVTSRALQGRGFAAVEARGNVVIATRTAGGGRLTVRSTDGGRSWRQSPPLPAETKDIQIVSATVAYALTKRTLYRSTDGGRTFRWRAMAPKLGSAGSRGEGWPSVEFSSARSGVIITTSGAFVTRDGGATLAPLPTPGARTPAAAAIFGSGVVVHDAARGTVLRHPTLLKGEEPSLTLRTAGRVRRTSGGRRTVTVVGMLRGATDDGPVALLGIRRAGSDNTVKRVLTPNVDGSFRLRVRLGKSERGVQAWSRGAVRPERTDLASVSRILRIR